MYNIDLPTDLLCLGDIKRNFQNTKLELLAEIYQNENGLFDWKKYA